MLIERKRFICLKLPLLFSWNYMKVLLAWSREFERLSEIISDSLNERAFEILESIVLDTRL
jgi:hypothetical protein